MNSENNTTIYNMNPIELARLGFSLIPVKDKRPLVPWEKYQTLRADEKQISEWQTQFVDCEWGVVTGPISGLLVLDIDGEEGRKSLEALKVEMPKTWVTKTRRGWHYYWRWEEKLEGVPTTKAGVWSNVDIRGAGGYVVAYDFIKGHSPADVSLTSAPEWLIGAVMRGPVEERVYRPGWMLEALSRISPGDPGQGRTYTFSRLIGRLNRDGWAAEDVFALLKPHADQHDYDLKKLWAQITDMTMRYAGQSKAVEYLGVSASRLLNEAAPNLKWTVAKLLPKEGIGILAGSPGTGKSWLLLDLAVDVSMGRPWLGKYETTRGCVMYVDEESSRDLLRHRLGKLLTYKEISPESLGIEFYVGEGVSLSNQANVERFRTKIETVKPTLIVMDSLIRVHKAEENNATALAQVFAVVKQLTRDYGCAVMFADHLRKPSQFQQSPEQEFRGSTEKLAAIDCGLILHRIADNLLLEQAKARYSEPIKSVDVRIADSGHDATGVKVIG